MLVLCKSSLCSLPLSQGYPLSRRGFILVDKTPLPKCCQFPTFPWHGGDCHSAFFPLSKVPIPVVIPWIFQTSDLLVLQGRQRALGTETRQDPFTEPWHHSALCIGSSLCTGDALRTAHCLRAPGR